MSNRSNLRITALAGGVGAAKLLRGVVRVIPSENLTAVVNTGDDDEFFGLAVSPDLDTISYTLANAVDTTKGWGLPSFGSKKAKAEDQNIDFEIFEDGDGKEIKMKIHGALEVEGDEYAIMSYSDSITSEFEIMKIKRGRGGEISYTGVDDEELYDDLSEAAAMHLESSGAL